LHKCNATWACIDKYGWSWKVAEDHVEATFILADRVGRLSRKKTMPVRNVPSRGEEVEEEVQSPGIMELHEELRAEVIKGMPLKDAFVFQKQDAQKNKQASQADDFDFLEY